MIVDVVMALIEVAGHAFDQHRATKLSDELNQTLGDKFSDEHDNGGHPDGFSIMCRWCRLDGTLTRKHEELHGGDFLESQPEWLRLDFENFCPDCARLPWYGPDWNPYILKERRWPIFFDWSPEFLKKWG
ncbi:hypothetical protein ACIPSE_03040 [Streptomyces sp. NPDC090106]|uniref:hypothetical protein n=1 Tax=Streptomyces sp. NPDC090106 TaxID=3365946 RepID=UPI0038230F77